MCFCVVNALGTCRTNVRARGVVHQRVELMASIQDHSDLRASHIGVLVAMVMQSWVRCAPLYVRALLVVLSKRHYGVRACGVA